jgi:hypothetical protein
MSEDLRFASIDAVSRDRVRKQREVILRACAAARDHVEECRSALVVARTDTASVAEVIDTRRNRAVRETERLAQHELEDVNRVLRLRLNSL